ncbi:TPA: hypothetical protein N0F65_011627 [Lagenidium giganteum]|uniref:Chromo domain-containing protein n=1 Tax=Lagenidium giganteum TaxID=4803 RepID=A0AAV2Z787_9STRA|nr:TPA: hypothetical protein N0F65_011627 [Lagenidium giganteum]
MLSTENLSTQHLGALWTGPFEVVKRISHDYYQLNIPERVHIHPVFHTSMLKPDIPADSKRGGQRSLRFQLPDGTEGELVERIVGGRRYKGKLQYRVKWVGQAKTTWEPLANLAAVQGLIDRYKQGGRGVA